MIHLPELISDLGFILIIAAAVTLLFRFLKQPVILGYIIAGFLVSPHVPFMPTVGDMESIKIWAEIGVIFLLFGLGLEFSFKKLMVVGKSATITAIVEVVIMLSLGYLIGQMFGWSKMDSLFLGGILSISSTTIIVRAFDELGLKGKKFVQLVFGILIVEDLFAVLLLVLLSTVAVTQSLSGFELGYSAVRLGFFLILWFIIGIYLLPKFLNSVRSLLSDETTLIVSIGLCLTMVMIATQLGFSPALGAFIMGSLFAETRDGKRIEHLMVPVRDLFAAIFFVSVGMLIDPRIIMEHWWVILVVTIITIVGKLLSTGLGGLLSGQSLSTSVQSGMSLAQIGEFSFIIATLGLTLGVVSDFLYPIAVSVSAISTFTTPYMIKYSHPFYLWLQKRIPSYFADSIGNYRSIINSSSQRSSVSVLWEAYGVKSLFNTVIVIAIAVGLSKLVLPYIFQHISSNPNLSSILIVVALVLSSPFLWALTFGGPSHSFENSDENIERLNALQFGFTLFRCSASFALIGFVISQFSPLLAVSGLLVILIIMLMIIFSPIAEHLYKIIEKNFVDNLNSKEHEFKKPKPSAPKLAPWDATLAEFVVSPHSELVAKTLQDSGLKDRFSVTIALIERGNQRIQVPKKDDIILPFDHLFVIGTDDQLEAFRLAVETKPSETLSENREIGLQSFVLSPTSSFVGHTIRNCGLRESINGLIVGIERSGNRILNPESTMVLQPEDLIWSVGDLRLIRDLITGQLDKKL